MPSIHICLIIIHAIYLLTYAKIPCNPDSFQFINPHDEIDYNKDYIYRIGNREEIGCAINATYFWTILDVNDKSKVINGVMQPSGITKEKAVRVNFAKFDDAFGKKFILRVVLIPQITHFPSYIVHFINIKEEKYFAKIVGGSHRFHRLGQGSLWLNLTLRRETGLKAVPETIKWQCTPRFLGTFEMYSTMNLEIYEYYLKANKKHVCKVEAFFPRNKNAFASQEIHILPLEKRPILLIDCVRNCLSGEAKTDLNTEFQYTCLFNCNGTVMWTLDPPDINIHNKFQYPMPKMLLIPAFTFEPGSTIKLAASMGDATAVYTLTYKLQKVTIKIRCIKNCFKKDKDITLKMDCQGDCNGLRYDWEVQPYPGSGLGVKINYETHNDILIFRKNTFESNMGATVSVKAADVFDYFFFIVEKIDPVIIILCENCVDNATRYSTEVSLRATCLKGCEQISRYKWKTLPNIPFTLIDSAEATNSTLIISPYTFKSETTMDVVATANNNYNGYFQLQFIEPGILEIICIHNCFPGNTSRSKPTALQAVCHKSCFYFITYTWAFSPRIIDPEKEFIELTSSSLIFPSNYFSSNISIVHISVTSDTETDTYELIFEEMTPILSFFCIQNCFDLKKIDEDVIYAAYCQYACTNIQFYWALEPSLSNWYDCIELSYRNLTITLKKNMFNPSETYHLIIYSQPFYAEHRKPIIFSTYEPQLKIECAENCKGWTHRRIVFQILCLKHCRKNNEYFWVLYPQFEHTTTENDTKLIIPPNLFADKQIIYIMAGTNGSSVSTKLMLKKKEVFITIECGPKLCNEHHNPLEKVEVIAKCRGNCESEDYGWDFSPLNPKFRLDKQILLDPKSDKITILPRSFFHGDHIKVTVTVDEESNQVFLKFRDPKPDFEIVCLENCVYSDPYSPVRLTIACDWHCEYVDMYHWTFFPPPPKPTYNIQMSPFHTNITINENVYKDGDIVFVNASWSAYIRSHKLAYVEWAPLINIICLRNCDYVISEDVVLEAVCQKKCTGSKSYKWKLYPKIKKGFYQLFASNNNTLLIPERSFEPSVKVNVTVCLGKGCDSKFIMFKRPKYKLELKCISNCDKDNKVIPSLSTKFEVKCLQICEDSFVFQWKIDQPPHNLIDGVDIIHPNKKTDVLILRSFLFQNGSKVNIKVFVYENEVTESINITFFQPSPKIILICDQNCGYPEPVKSTIFSVVCFENCFNLRYLWDVLSLRNVPRKEDPSVFMVEKDNLSIEILGNVFKDGDLVQVRVTVGSVFAMKTVMFASGPSRLKILCNPSCKKADPTKTLKLHVICLERCDVEKYSWDLYPTPEDFLWSLSIATMNDNKTLVINPDVFIKQQLVRAEVFGVRGAFASVNIVFVVVKPTLTLRCLENCNHIIGSDLIFLIKCEGDCENLYEHLICHLEPDVPNTFFVTYNILEIRTNSFHDGDLVSVICNLRKLTAKYSFKFISAAWDGNCAVSPIFGYSGQTEHTIDCTGFFRNATYEIHTERHIILYEKYNYITNILFMPGIPLKINIRVEMNWTMYKKISLFVYSSPYQLNDPNTVAIRNLRLNDLIQTDKEQHEQLNTKFKLLVQLIETRKYVKAFQLACILEINLRTVPDNIFLHYRNILILHLMKMVDYVLPVQILKFIFLSYLTKKIDYMILKNTIFLTTQVADKHFYWNNGAIINNYKSNVRVSVLLINVSHYFINTWVLDFAMNSSNSFSIRQSTSLSFVFKHVSRYIEIALSLMSADEDYRYTRTPLAAGVVYKTIKSSLTVKKLTVPDRFSYVIFDPQSLNVDEDQVIELKLAILSHEFNDQLKQYERQMFIADRLLYVSSSTDNGQLINSNFLVSFFLISKKNFTLIQAKVKDDYVSVWEIHAPTGLTMEFKIKGNFLLTLGCVKPDDDYVETVGRVLTEDTIYFYTIECSPFYFGALGKEDISLEYVILECKSWKFEKTDSNDTGCYVQDIVTDEDTIICNCNKNGFLTANANNYPYTLIKPRIHHYEKLKPSRFLLSLIILAGLIIMLIYAVAIWFDIKAIKRVYFLNEFTQGMKETYLIGVQTGLWPASGTTARVGFQLVGKWASSDSHVFNLQHKGTLQRNALDMFIMSTPILLGDIKKIIIWHDSYGSQPEWFCESVAVRQLYTGKLFVFAICNWFSIYRHPFNTFGIFRPLNKKQHPSLMCKIMWTIRWFHTNLSFFVGRRLNLTYCERITLSLLSGLTIATICALTTYYFGVNKVLTFIFIIIIALSAEICITMGLEAFFLIRDIYKI